ncbi:MAG TPA: hypothetical protein VF997_20920, partial [Polyangia bacterium]
MAEIEIGPLTDRLTDDEIAELAAQLEKVGAPQLPRGDEGHQATLGDGMDDNALSEFMDRLEGHDIAADIYLPVEFEGIVEVAELRVGSLPLLLEVLEELKDELDDEEEEAEDEEAYDDDQKILAQQLRSAWKLFSTGGAAA